MPGKIIDPRTGQAAVPDVRVIQHYLLPKLGLTVRIIQQMGTKGPLCPIGIAYWDDKDSDPPDKKYEVIQYFFRHKDVQGMGSMLVPFEAPEDEMAYVIGVVGKAQMIMEMEVRKAERERGAGNGEDPR